MKGMRWKELAVRVALLLLGLTTAHLGVTLFLESGLGSDPFNVLIQGLHFGLPWPSWISHGEVHLLVSLLILLILLVVDRGLVKIGTVLCMALGGPVIDLWTLLLTPLFPTDQSLLWRLLALVLGCLILSFGMTIVIQSGLRGGPNDLVALSISELRHLPFGPVRVTVDVCYALVGWLFGGVVGLGTVVCAALVGPVAHVLLPISGRLRDGCLRKILGELPSPER